MGTLSGKYIIGEPIDYTSIYGYPKRRFPVIPENGSFPIGHVKEELVLDGEGKEVSKVFYTRNIARPFGHKRFYESVEALILAFGGEIGRVKKITKPRAVKKAPPAKKRAVKPVVKARKKKAA